MLQHRTPLWVLLGASLLACIAGWVNAIGLLAVVHEALTHVTGTVTRSAVSFGSGDMAGALRACFVVIAFFAGAATAGLIIGTPELKRGRHYGVGLVLEAALLGLAWVCFAWEQPGGEAAAAAAAGLQNGLVTTWSGSILRTSHVTGVVTDLGLALGHRLRSQPNGGRAGLQLAIVIGFFFGGVLGAEAWAVVGPAAFAGPVALCLLAAGAYVGTLPRSTVSTAS